MFDRKKCEKCTYSAKLIEEICCVYILIEGHRRCCYEGECDKFKELKGKRRNRITWDGRYTSYEEEQEHY